MRYPFPPPFPPTTTRLAPGKKIGPADPRSRSPLFNDIQLEGVNQSRRVSVRGASFRSVSPKLELPFQSPFPVEANRLPLPSITGAAPAIQIPARLPRSVSLKVASCWSVEASKAIRNPWYDPVSQNDDHPK